MRFLIFFPVALSVLLGVPASSEATDPQTLAERIDHHINQRLLAEGLDSGQIVADESFLRRVTLDLAGRIPTTAERDKFLDQKENKADSPTRRKQLVEQLIKSPDYAYHARNQFDILLLLRSEHNASWREYLLEATNENRSWDQIFREIFQPEDTLSSDVRPVSYLKKQLNDLDALTNGASIKWLGVNIACAKCHDHPLVDDWTQDHYYGMTSFFKRTFRTKQGFLSERFEGLPKYTDIYGDEQQPGLMFLTGEKVDVPPMEMEEEALKKLQEAIKKSEKDDKSAPPPRPDFRPRSKFVELALGDEENRFFAKNLVNRTWARLLGRGLVHPLDQMHSQNPASHPELLEELAEAVVESGYDVRHLTQAIVLSNVYARTAQDSEEQPRSPDLFAVSVPRPLTPRQLSLSLRIAGQNPEKMQDMEDNDSWSVEREKLEKASEGIARKLLIPTEGFQVPVTEALWFSNNLSLQKDLLSTSKDRLVGYLQTLETDDEVVSAAFASILNRTADAAEKIAIENYLAEREDRRDDALKQVVWALLATPEFRFNH
ncbi:MAG: DUF1549 domain-containing protein [Planctomycetaceae bacterium]|nr:DUF1549 domain-containing protein [Planctomycetaceae bacterium]